MAKDGSVAPKERVNIRYKPATGDAKEEVELPFKMVMLGDYTLKEDETPLEERQRINIAKDNFNDVMRSMDLSLDLSVDDKLSEESGSKMGVSLQFKEMKDFTPDAIAQQVPELKRLLELREALSAVKGPLGNVPAFRKALKESLQDEAARKKLLDELTAREGSEDG